MSVLVSFALLYTVTIISFGTVVALCKHVTAAVTEKSTHTHTLLAKLLIKTGPARPSRN